MKLKGLDGGSAFWKSYAGGVIDMVTDGHARLNQLKAIKERYEKDVLNTYFETFECKGCRHFFKWEGGGKCHICDERYCGSPYGGKCTVKQCTRCYNDCCLSDRTFSNGRILCIDCIDFNGNGSGSGELSYSLESDSSQNSPSESEEEEEEEGSWSEE